MTKISDELFWEALSKSAGIYARTADYIKRQYDVDITRQAVAQRAKMYPDRLEDVRNAIVDVAENVIIGIMEDAKTKRVDIKMRAAEFVLLKSPWGKKRGWSDRNEISFDQTAPLRQIQYTSASEYLEEIAKRKEKEEE